MTCQDYRKIFAEAYYGELDEKLQSEFNNHLASCAGCSSAYDQMNQTLKLMDQRLDILPEDEYMAHYWDKLEPKINMKSEEGKIVQPRQKIFFLRPLPAWSYGIAAVLLIVLGIYLGRTLFSPAIQVNDQPMYGGNASEKRDTNFIATKAIDSTVSDHLDRSKVLLLGVVNSTSEEQSTVNYKSRQRVSRELIQQANYLKATLKDPDQERIKQLIGDLEIILMQLANYSNESGVPLIELVKQGVEKKSILLKINIEQIRALSPHVKSSVKQEENKNKSKV